MAEQWEKSVSLQKSERAHSVCQVEEVSLLVLAEEKQTRTLPLPRVLHACAARAQAVQ